VHELIAEQRPDAVAVVGKGEELTYGVLDARANQLAHHLRSMGAGPETIVGLCLDRGPDMIVAILATWKAGAAYLPLDPAYPPNRLTYMLADSRAAILLTTDEILDELPVGRIRTTTLDDPLIQVHPTTIPGTTTHPDQTAYLIYTSGSTGKPKGVRTTHRGLLGLVQAQRAAFGVDETSVVLQFASFSFDAAVSEIAVTLAAGARLVIADADQRTQPGQLITDEQITVATLPPSLLATIGSLPMLKTLISAGERLDPALAKAWAPNTRLLNAYGPTETTVCATIATITGQDTPIGPPIPNTQVHVLDQHLQPVPVGVPGELHIGGTGLARGYHAKPALTAARFIATSQGERLYRTGDRARWRPDGQLDYLGRTDEQVKIRGFRIEPAEVQHALTTHPAITAAAVVPYGDRLVAYFVPTELEQPTDLREHLATTLPDHMIPSAFIELTELPTTPNGKLDRAALPAPDTDRPDLAGGYQPPTTPTEELLAGIWAELLALKRIGVHDNFFELGGHSLLATQVISRVKAAGYDMSLGDLFDHPTIAGSARLIAQDTASGLHSMVKIRRGTTAPALFCVHSAAGGVGDFAEMAGHLAQGQQFYGLQARGLDDSSAALPSIKEMAQAYLDEVTSVQPDGPYLLAGWSMGGYIAIEMARQARAKGLDVAGVFVFGPPMHQARGGLGAIMDRKERRRVRELLAHLDDTIGAPPGIPLDPAYEAQLLERWPVEGRQLAALRAGDKQALKLGRVLVTNVWASLQYRPAKSYDGRVVLFMPRDDADEEQRATVEQWRSILRQEPEVVPVPGEHESVVHDEGAHTIGAWLRDEINRQTPTT
jgi:amino acid adenylation domain-containing protein